MDPDTSIGRLCLGENNQGSVAKGIENKEQWEGPKSFMRLAKGIANFGNGFITIHPELDPFLDDSEETKKFEDDWDHLLDIDFGDIPKINNIDTGSDINVMPYRIYAKLGREEVKKVNQGITMLNHSKVEPMGVLKDILFQVGVTTIIAKFIILDMPIDRDAPILAGRGFLYTCGGILNTRDRVTSTFDGISHQTFRAAKTSLNTKKSDSDDEEDYGIKETILEHQYYKGNFCKKEEGDGQPHVEIRLKDPYGNVYDQGFKTKPTKRKLSKYHKLSDVMSPN
nr:hypothetical protein [Tanacetum cinerariifolium]